MTVTLSDLSSEVLLRILGYVDDVGDLSRIRQTNRRLSALGRDLLLWKRLFTRTFLVNSTAKVDLIDAEYDRHGKRRRLDRSLSGQHEPLELRSPLSYTDWYTLYKISHNWRTGNYASRLLQANAESSDKSHRMMELRSRTERDNTGSATETIVAMTDDFVFTTSRNPTVCSEEGHLLAYPANAYGNGEVLSANAKLYLRSQGVQEQVAVTAITVETAGASCARPKILLACTDSTLRIVEFDKASKTLEQRASIATPQGQEVRLIAACGLHVATCSVDFHITLLRLNESGDGGLRIIGTTRSHSCLWPAAMKFSSMSEDPQEAQLTVAFVKETYPSGWTVAIQRFDSKRDRFYATCSTSAPRFSASLVSVAGRRKQLKGKMSVKGSNLDVRRLTSLCYEDDFIVIGSRDNSVYCFKVEGDSNQIKDVAETLRIRHIRTLQDHTGSVHSVSLNDGRCVTGGGDGSVRVWRLSDESAYLARTFGLTAKIRARLRGGTRKVVTLRLPVEDKTERQARKRKRIEEDGETSIPLTLSDILRDNSSSTISSPSSIVRWVASAFDRIISVSQMPTEPSSCRLEANGGQQQSIGEQVQIWSFS